MCPLLISFYLHRSKIQVNYFMHASKIGRTCYFPDTGMDFPSKGLSKTDLWTNSRAMKSSIFCSMSSTNKRVQNLC